MTDDADRPANQFQPGNDANPDGRPSGFRPEFVEQARKLAQLGAVDVEIADFFDVSVRTLYRWRNQYVDLAAAMKVGKDAVDDRVEQSLLHRAIGFTHPAVKHHVVAGEVVETAYTEHYPPDTAAGIFWLKNRRKADWRDKVDHEHTGKDGGDIMARVTVDAVISEMRRLDDEC